MQWHCNVIISLHLPLTKYVSICSSVLSHVPKSSWMIWRIKVIFRFGWTFLAFSTQLLSSMAGQPVQKKLWKKNVLKKIPPQAWNTSKETLPLLSKPRGFIQFATTVIFLLAIINNESRNGKPECTWWQQLPRAVNVGGGWLLQTYGGVRAKNKTNVNVKMT